jgi:hypothetical protein
VNTALNTHPEQNYPDLFDGIGKIKDKKVKLHIDPEQQSHRRIPFHIRKDVEKELQRLEDLDVIERVEGPTPLGQSHCRSPKENRRNSPLC